MTGHFERACDLWDRVAGPADLEEFGAEFDRLLAGLEHSDIVAISQFVDTVRSARQGIIAAVPAANASRSPETVNAELGNGS